MALISFVIPAFNMDGFVARAIDSALAQTHTPVEVIVIDDGSTDDTPKALASYRERPNVTLIRQTNAGLSAARNRGLASSRGELVCFLDADDFLAPTFAAKLRAALGEDPKAGFAYSDVQRVDRFGERADDYSVATARRTVHGDIFDSLILGGYFTPNCVLVRRSVLDAVGPFDPELGGHADYEMWLRIVAAGYRAAFVSERLAYYRLHPGSMSQDVDHMRATRILALERVARRTPAVWPRPSSACRSWRPTSTPPTPGSTASGTRRFGPWRPGRTTRRGASSSTSPKPARPIGPRTGSGSGM